MLTGQPAPLISLPHRKTDRPPLDRQSVATLRVACDGWSWSRGPSGRERCAFLGVAKQLMQRHCMALPSEGPRAENGSRPVTALHPYPLGPLALGVGLGSLSEVDPAGAVEGPCPRGARELPRSIRQMPPPAQRHQAIATSGHSHTVEGSVHDVETTRYSLLGNRQDIVDGFPPGHRFQVGGSSYAFGRFLWRLGRGLGLRWIVGVKRSDLSSMMV